VLVQLMMYSLRLLGRSILGTFRSSTTESCEIEKLICRTAPELGVDDMQIIPGYWDPRNLCFIEEPEELEIDQLEFCSLGTVSRAKQTFCVSDASASVSETSDAFGKTKKR
jgi:hypothetical protein